MRKSIVVKIISIGVLSGIIGMTAYQQYADASNPTESHIETPFDNLPTPAQKNEFAKIKAAKAAEVKAAQEAKQAKEAKEAKQAQEAQEAQQAQQAQQAQEAQQALQAPQGQQAPKTYYINAQYMELEQDQAFIDSNPSLFAHNTINGVDYFAAHNGGGGSFISGLAIGDIIVVNGATKYRVDTIQIVEWNSEEAWSILNSGVQAVIQTCTDSTAKYDYFNTLSRVS